MKILWLINIAVPEAAKLLNKKEEPYGGWLINSSLELIKNKDIDLYMAFPEKGILKYKILKGQNIKYIPFKVIKDSKKNILESNAIFEQLLGEIRPDIIHIYGTELAHTLSMVQVAKKKNIKTVISIQGLVSICAKHIYASLPFKVIYGKTIRNIIRHDSIYDIKNLYIRRGENEIEALKNIKHVIGRTCWDFACTKQINSNLNYHFCNEILREIFYLKKWDINNVERNSIFLSQGQYPIKGLHFLIEAMPIILEKFPNTKIYIGGKNIIAENSFFERILQTSYGKYIKKLIKKYKLENNIIFTGILNEREICDRYLKSHIFVCPSTIENSPNSLGEAMILGVPCVAANVGGIQDMLEHKKEGFTYQGDSSYMLAHYILMILEDDSLAQSLSKAARAKAIVTHDKIKNTEELLKIYNKILE